jgi:hypothetical protein
VELESTLGRLACEDFTVENGDRSVREVALEVLVHAAWVSPEDADACFGVRRSPYLRNRSRTGDGADSPARSSSLGRSGATTS